MSALLGKPAGIGNTVSGMPPSTEIATPWQSRSFRLLLTGQTVSAFGNALTPVAIAFAVIDLGGSATELGLVIAAYALAQVLVAVVGGIIGDRLPRSVVLRAGSLVAAVVQAALAVALLRGWAGLVLIAVLGMITSCMGALVSPSSQALTPQTVPPAILAQAIALRRIAANTAMVLGFGVAGMLVAGFGSGWAVAVDALSFAVAAVCFSLIRLPSVREPGRPRTSMLTDLRVGAAEVARHTWLWVLIGHALVYHLFYGGAQGVLGPIVVGEAHGKPAWGWALAALMLGFIVGGLVTLRWRPARPVFVGTLLLTLTAAFPAALAANAGLALVLVGAFLHGFGLEIFSVNWDLSIQQSVPADSLARVYSLDLVGSFVARPIGLALTGPLAEAYGYSRWLWIVTGVIVGATAIVLLVPSVRRLRRAETPVDASVGA